MSPSWPMYAVSTRPAIGSAAKLASAGSEMAAISLSKSVSLQTSGASSQHGPLVYQVGLWQSRVPESWLRLELRLPACFTPLRFLLLWLQPYPVALIRPPGENCKTPLLTLLTLYPCFAGAGKRSSHEGCLQSLLSCCLKARQYSVLLYGYNSKEASWQQSVAI